MPWSVRVLRMRNIRAHHRMWNAVTSQSDTRVYKQSRSTLPHLKFDEHAIVKSEMKVFKKLRNMVCGHQRKENPRVKKLQKQLEIAAENMKECKKKADELKERNNINLQSFTKLRSSLKSHMKRTNTVKNEREIWATEQERLEKSIAQLEATLDSEINKSEQEIEKANMNFEIRPLTSKECSMDILKYCENQWKIVDEATEKMIEAEECLQKVAEQVADLNSAIREQELRGNKIKWKLHKRNFLQLTNIIKLENALIHCEEDKKSAEYKRDKLMKNKKRLKEHIVHLEAIFACEKNKWEQEGQKSKMHIEEEVTHQKDLSFLKFCKEQQKIVEEVRQNMMEPLGHLQKTAQQVASSDLRQQEPESDEITWNIEEFSRLQMREHEQMENSVALLEYTLNNIKYIWETQSL